MVKLTLWFTAIVSRKQSAVKGIVAGIQLQRDEREWAFALSTKQRDSVLSWN